MHKEREIMVTEFNRVFNERYKRAHNIKKLARSKRLKELRDMIKSKLKCKQ